MWWLLTLLVLVSVIVGSCAWSVAVLGGRDASLASGVGKDAVGVIKLEGVIAGTGDTYAGTVTPEYFRELLTKAEEDKRIKAVLIRVNSPGGTAAASEEIASYVKGFDKPVIVSIGDIGASGAYMVSSQADEIWAMPATAVGSIGVITEIPNAAGLAEKLGLEFQVITAGKYKDAGSPYRPLTKDERALIQGDVDEVYGQFIDIVSEGRKMQRSKVESLATGWAWNGVAAQKLGLVDRIGTYDDALESAAKAGGIKGDYDTITLESDSIEGLLGSLLRLAGRLGALETMAGISPNARAITR
jgi:protease-4